jgi:AraC-like DNA-binding protein
MVKPRNISDRTLLDFSALGFRDLIMAGRYSYNCAHPPLRPHLHRDIMEICVLEQGSQTYYVGPRRYKLTGGDVFITKPGEVHGTGQEPENKGKLYWVELRTVFPGRSILSLPAKESRLLLNCLQGLSVRHLRHGEILIPTLERIFKVFADERNPLRIVNLRNLLLRFLLDVAALAEHKEAPRLDLGIKRALTYVESHLTAAIPVAVLAREARMSESHFKKQFSRQIGMPPIEYASQRRIEYGKQKLRCAGLTITQIAMDTGFATSQHFATAFKRFTGLTPREFRQREKIYLDYMAPEIGHGTAFHPVS